MVVAKSLWLMAVCLLTTASATQKERHQRLVESNLQRLEDIMDSNMNNCDKCLAGMALGRDVSLETPLVVPDVMVEFCRRHRKKSKKHEKLCEHKFGRSTVNSTTLGDDITNALGLMAQKPKSLEAQYACHYLVGGACPLPAVPNFDLSHWWPPKPENARAPDPSGKTFNVLHISDFHVDLDYTIGSESDCSQSMCCTVHSFHRDSRDTILSPARTYGGYHCDAPQDLLQSAMDSVSTIHRDRDFEFAIFTGDMSDHEEIQYQSYEDAVESEKVSYRFMKHALNKIPFYITLGNHDSYPYGQIAQAKSGYENRFAWNTELAYEMWTDFDWLSEEEAANIKNHYAGFSVTTKREGLRVISLNANFWYISNYYNYWGMETDPDSSGMLRFLSDELLDCEKNNQRAWIIAHVPTGGSLEDALPPASQVFYQILERFSPHVVAGLFFGHTHRDEFQVMYAHNATQKTVDNALTVAFLDESVTPFRDHNPGWRYYEVDEETFSIINIHHYYSKLNETFGSTSSIDIATHNITDDTPPVWEYGYSARAAYDPENTWPESAPLNATFWHNVVHQKILKTQSYRDMYEIFAHRRAPAGSTTGCESAKCLHELYCYMTTLSVPQAAACLASAAPLQLEILSLVSSAHTMVYIGMGIVAVLAGIVLGTVLYNMRYARTKGYESL